MCPAPDNHVRKRPTLFFPSFYSGAGSRGVSARDTVCSLLAEPRISHGAVEGRRPRSLGAKQHEDGGNMRFKISMCLAGITFLVAFAIAPVQVTSQSSQVMYKIIPLPTLGGVSGAGNGINDRGWITGAADQAGDTVSHAAAWVGSQLMDLGALGGQTFNSAVAWPNKANNGVIVGISDTDKDQIPNDNFSCFPFYASSSPTGKVCNGFRWANGAMTALPPLPGGLNSYATALNNRGQIVGWAENGVVDPTCNTALQTLQFRAVIWEPDGTMKELPPLPGDSTSAATSINAQGTVVGFSLPAGQDGTRNFEAFLWTHAGGLVRLGKLPGDIRAEALGVNENNQVVGLSRGGPHVFRAFIWQNGVMTDLNCLTVPGSPFLLFANDINDHGEISGELFDPIALFGPPFRGIPVLNGTGSTCPAATNATQTVTFPDSVRKRAKKLVGDPLGDD